MENNNEEEFVDIELLKKNYDNLLLKHESLKVDYETLKTNHKSLVDKLRERVECPVCLEVPETGPISACPNGHLVCQKCTRINCPTCRSKMFDGKSLLASSVLENIEHKCRNVGV